MPRRRSSAKRSGSMPVSARTRVDLPWSTCPAVATTCISRAGSIGCTIGDGAHRGHEQRRPRRGRRSAGRAATGRARRVRRPAGRRGAAARRSRRAARPPSPAASTPGAPPPPTAPSDGTTAAPSTAAATAVARRRRSAVGVGGEVVPGRGASPRSAWPRARRASACRRAAPGRAGGGAAARRPRRRRAASPACGPPSSLSPLHVTTAAPARSARRGVGLVRQQRVRGEQPAADVGDHRHAERRRARRRRRCW